MKLPDATLDHLADLYVFFQVKEHGYTLEQFLRTPEAILHRLERLSSAIALGLEPEQEHPDAVHVREVRAENRLRQRGEILIQKLWHGARRRGRRDADGARRL